MQKIVLLFVSVIFRENNYIRFKQMVVSLEYRYILLYARKLLYFYQRPFSLEIQHVR